MAAPTAKAATELRPHAGAQSAFLATSADIAIYGGAAGGGKSWALLVEPLRHARNPGFGCVIFRRELTRITNEGGLWDEAADIYLPGASQRQSPRMEFRFRSGAKVQFGHLEHEDTKHAWSGAQIGLLEFDQLEEFTAGQFWFLLSRNRTSCGVRPYVRATANPVPPEDETGGWLAKLIAWWIDPSTGYPIPERSGVVRWLVRINEEIRWSATREGAVQAAIEAGLPPEEAAVMPKSLTFIPASTADNPTISADYLANLHALTLVERERLLRGNWKIRPAAGLVFNRAWFDIVDAAPAQTVAVRYWDKAASQGKGDYSSGLRLDWADGVFYVADVTRGQWSYGERNRVMEQKAEADGQAVEVWVEQEPGSGGKESAERSIQELAKFTVHADRVTGSKLVRAGPAAAQAEVRNIKLVKADWNDSFLTRLHNFTGADGGKDDDVDSLSGALNKLAAAIAGARAFVGQPRPSPHKPPVEQRQREREERRRERAIQRAGGGRMWRG